MKFYWSNREGQTPPLNSSVRIYPFSSQNIFKSATEQVLLPSPMSIKVIKKTFLPSREIWIKNVEKALQLIEQKKIQKVVLARSCILELDSAPDPFAITAALKQNAEGAFVFCVQSEKSSFLGASPELLFAREKEHLISEAIAATRRRGNTKEEDALFEKELLSSTKELREFSFVQTHLQEHLLPFCAQPLTFTPLSIHKTKNVQHLYSQCRGLLKKEVTDSAILETLHPTPALCGFPREKAYSLIQELEPFDRGYYGGVIGWSTAEKSEWVVGIRSCLLQGKVATLFSGTGIVEGSDPEAEWDELNQKLKLYDRILDY